MTGPKVVIVGNGMAGARLAALLPALEPRVRVCVVGEEPGPAYNRVLLSGVLAGTHTLEDIALPRYGPVELRTGVAVAALERDRRRVVLADGSALGYDRLVLATGSEPVIPPLPGLQPGRWPRGLTTLRTTADAATVLDLATTAASAVVVGGGILGIEAARGLAARGLAVSVVHATGHLLERHLDPCAASLVQARLESLGIAVSTADPVAELLSADGVVTGVRLAGGARLDAGLVVLACGTRPRVELARAAGLAVSRGVVVDDTLRSVTDPSVLAVGECAEHRGVVCGLVAPVWDQAAAAARTLAGQPGGYAGAPSVVRLKAHDIEVAALGESTAEGDLVAFTDTRRGVYQRLTLDRGRLIGAVLVGDLAAVGELTAALDRPGPLPEDLRSLLFPTATGPGELADSARVCVCAGVSAGTVRQAIAAGAATVAEVGACTRAGTGCGSCRSTVARLLADQAAGSASGTARPTGAEAGAA